VLVIVKNLKGMDFQNIDYLTRRISLVGILMLNIFINFRPKIILFNFPSEGKNQKQGNSTTLKSENFKGTKKTVNRDLPEIGSNFRTGEKSFESIKSRIISFLENEKVFTEKGLNLSSFSIMLGLPLKSVSQGINSEFGIGFNELLNQYRVKFA